MGLFQGSNEKTKYESDIVLGERYRDEQTGIEGVATIISFFQHACERVSLELVVDGKIEEFTFDSPRLTRVSTGERATAEKTGGPDRGSSHLRPSHLGRG
jgi:hypothetical protein